jgi:hypothetical protein
VGVTRKVTIQFVLMPPVMASGVVLLLLLLLWRE